MGFMFILCEKANRYKEREGTVFMKKTDKIQAYEDFYQRLSAPFSKNPQYIKYLNRCNSFLTGAVYVLYPLFLVWLCWKKDRRVIKVTAVPAVFFVLLSVFRKKLNRRRPYESCDLQPLIEKDTKGKSMPSRHVFSGAIIAMAFLSVNVPLGIIFLIWSLLIGVVRVIGGVHYPSDVAAGWLIGAAAGLLMLTL